MIRSDHWSREQVFVAGKVPIYAINAFHWQDVPLHDHAFVEIVTVLGGSARHVTRAGSSDLRPGDVLVLRPGVWHGYAHASDLRIHNCCFGSELLSRELAWTLDDPVVGQLLWGPRHGGGTMHFHFDREAVLAAATAFGAMRSPDGWAAPIGRLLTFLGALSEDVSVQSSAALAISPMVAGIVRRLEADIPRAWRMDDLTQLTGISAGHLTRQFTQAMGVSPMAYLTRCRAEHAAARLIQTRDAIADIAVAVGWEDPVYFSRRFRQHYAMTPSEYRRRFSQQSK